MSNKREAKSTMVHHIGNFMKSLEVMWYYVVFCVFVCLVVLEFELRASPLLGRHFPLDPLHL
jgi:hypothetical protein